MSRLKPICAAVLAATALCSASAYADDSTTTNEPIVDNRYGLPVHGRLGNPVQHRFGDRAQATPAQPAAALTEQPVNRAQ